MKKALLILFMLLLPWQVITAAERNFVHVTSSQQGQTYFAKHFSEHVELVMHHHDDDDDGPSHDDDSKQSSRHLVDSNQAFSFNALFPVPQSVAVLPILRFAPAVRLEPFHDRTTLPPRRPPRAFA